MEMTVNYLGDVQFEAEARGHKIICDQPLDNGGADEGMTRAARSASPPKRSSVR